MKLTDEFVSWVLTDALPMHCTEKAVDALMRGNDTQCFTTKQFVDKQRELYSDDSVDSDVARLWLTRFAVPVGPDLWTSTGTPCSTPYLPPHP